KAFLDLPARDRRASAGINADDGAPVSPAGLATDRRIDHSAFPAHAALYDRVVGSLDLAAFLQRDERGLGPGVFRDDEHTRHDSVEALDDVRPPACPRGAAAAAAVVNQRVDQRLL